MICRAFALQNTPMSAMVSTFNVMIWLNCLLLLVIKCIQTKCMLIRLLDHLHKCLYAVINGSNRSNRERTQRSFYGGLASLADLIDCKSKFKVLSSSSIAYICLFSNVSKSSGFCGTGIYIRPIGTITRRLFKFDGHLITRELL